MNTPPPASFGVPAHARRAPRARRSAGAVPRRGPLLALTAALLTVPALPVTASPPSPEELAALCANAEDSAHCGRLVEAVQLKRLPNLAVRDGIDLRVSLFPRGTTTFTDDESPTGGRSYSLFDYLSEINAVVLYTTVGDRVSFTLLQRINGQRVDLPAEPKVAPDRTRFATADFCPSRCVNELAVWRVGREGVLREAVWKPAEAWTDAAVSWKDASTLVIEYTVGEQSKTLERRLDDPAWSRPRAR